MVTNEIVAKKDSNFNHTTVRADRSARTKVDNNRSEGILFEIVFHGFNSLQQCLIY